MKKTYKALLLAAVAVVVYTATVRVSPIIAQRKHEREQVRLTAEFNVMKEDAYADVSRLLRWQLPDDTRLAMSQRGGSNGESVWLHYHGEPEQITEIRDQIAPSGWRTNLTGTIKLVPDYAKRIWNPPEDNIWVLSEMTEESDPVLKLWVLDQSSGGIFFCMTRMSKIRERPNQTDGE